MKMYVLSLGAGLLVGVLYGLLNVRSPAPPIIALVGLLGILAGEQIPALVRHYLDKQPAATSWHEQVKPHMFGHLPGATIAAGDAAATPPDSPPWMQYVGEPASSDSQTDTNTPLKTDGKADAPIARDPNA
ncbi:DUF1427 family protein [Pigmentiphaga aceris]|uniref:DUF1427 family protein n=1 Tax=Pigmentiphaga aceris TaxID=1940612 RepID=A0A5C0AU31_9BURK|nr:DUF1427 family protein [Pigmentiphaga aceris]